MWNLFKIYNRHKSDVTDVILVPLLLALNRIQYYFGVTIVDFKLANTVRTLLQCSKIFRDRCSLVFSSKAAWKLSQIFISRIKNLPRGSKYSSKERVSNGVTFQRIAEKFLKHLFSLTFSTGYLLTCHFLLYLQVLQNIWRLL